MSIASELTNYSNLLATAYDKAEDKGATIPDNKNLQNLTDAIDSIPKGGGDVVNGIIEEYLAATEIINANTFVEFINELDFNADKKLSDTTYGGAFVSATILSSNKIFIAHNGDAPGKSSANSRLYGIVCTISGTTIIPGIDTKLSDTTHGGRAVSAIALNSDSVFIAHNGDYGRYLYGIVCNISGTTIASSADTQLSSTKYGGSSTSVIALNSSSVFIAHNNSGDPLTDSASRSYGIVCTISGTTITPGTDTRLSTTRYGGHAVSAVTLSSDSVFIAHNGDETPSSSSSRVYGIVCTISGTTITPGTDTKLSDASYGGLAVSATPLSAEKVFVAHHQAPNSTTFYSPVYGVVCIISNATITTGVDTQLSSTGYGGKKVSAVSISADSVFIAHNGDGAIPVSGTSSDEVDSRIYGIVCTISGTTITPGTDAKLSDTTYGSYAVSALLLGPGRVFIAHAGEGGDNAQGRIYAIRGCARARASVYRIEGLTKTECTASSAGEVWVLNQNS